MLLTAVILYKFLCGHVFSSLGYVGRSEFLDHVWWFSLAVWGATKLFPRVAAPFPATVSEGSDCDILGNTCYLSLSLAIPVGIIESGIKCSFDLHCSLFSSDFKIILPFHLLQLLCLFGVFLLIFIFEMVFSFYFELFCKFFTSLPSFSWFDLCCSPTFCPVSPFWNQSWSFMDMPFWHISHISLSVGMLFHPLFSCNGVTCCFTLLPCVTHF